MPVKIVKTFSCTTLFEDLIKYFIVTSKKFYPQIILKFCFRFTFKITKPNLYGSRSERRELKTRGLVRIIDIGFVGRRGDLEGGAPQSVSFSYMSIDD